MKRLIAHRLSKGLRPCSPETGAYCQARKRLPEEFFSNVARQTGRVLDSEADPRWLWKGRRVYAYDGSTVSMPDTLENQREYPQPDTQKSGLGFPLARIGAVFSLACGAVLDLGICRYAGKGQSELGMHGSVVAWLNDNRLVDLSGQHVALLKDAQVINYSAHQIGTFDKGWFRDPQGRAAGFMRGAEGGPLKPMLSAPPVPAIAAVPPIPPIPPIPYIPAIPLFDWSDWNSFLWQ